MSHIETSQLICSANQLTGFYMCAILVVKGLNQCRNRQSLANIIVSDETGFLLNCEVNSRNFPRYVPVGNHLIFARGVQDPVNPAGIYMFKVNNRNTRTRCEVCSKLTIKTVERWWHQTPFDYSWSFKSNTNST